jgi:protein gp37
MAKNSNIGWTEDTWNPIQGCKKVSPGCKNCYMYTEKSRYGQDPSVVVRSKPATFNAPLKWKDPTLIFTCSWSDWFIEEGDEHRAEMWDIVRRTPQHTYQILTKRAHRIKDHLPEDWGDGWPNVWLGVSVENQDEVWRLNELFKVPAVVRFASFEPLLGPIEVGHLLCCAKCGRGEKAVQDDNGIWYHKEDWGGAYPCPTPKTGRGRAVNNLHWGIVGGESDGLHGTNARECNLDWIHDLTEQFSGADTPLFVKQLGAKPVYHDTETHKLVPYPIKSKKGDNPAEFPCHFLQQWPEVWQQRLDAAEQVARGAK